MERRGGEPRKGLPTNEKSKKVPTLDGNSEEGEEGTVVSDGGGGEEEKKRRLSSPSSSTGILRKGGGVGASTGQLTCQAEKCTEDLTDARRYYRRHKVCEVHSKAPVVIVAGLRQRFCQQCSRFIDSQVSLFPSPEFCSVCGLLFSWFHDLSEFDDTKRSCRKRLAGHNERRRKISSETQERLEPLQAG